MVTHDGIQRVSPKRGARIIHVETNLGIINIYLGLHDRYGREVESIQLQPDDYAGEPPVRVCGSRFVRLKRRPR